MRWALVTWIQGLGRYTHLMWKIIGRPWTVEIGDSRTRFPDDKYQNSPLEFNMMQFRCGVLFTVIQIQTLLVVSRCGIHLELDITFDYGSMGQVHDRE